MVKTIADVGGNAHPVSIVAFCRRHSDPVSLIKIYIVESRKVEG